MRFGIPERGKSGEDEARPRGPQAAATLDSVVSAGVHGATFAFAFTPDYTSR